MSTLNTSVVISGIGHYLPERIVTSDEVTERVNAVSNNFTLPPRAIRGATGVQRRHFVSTETSSDLAAAAGKIALADAGAHPDEVDVLIFASGSQDVTEPATANVVQEKLACLDAFVFDVKNACNGFLNALDVAVAKILLGQVERILVTSGEVGSAYIDWNIEGEEELEWKLPGLTLGDAGAAVLLEGQHGPDRGTGLLPGVFRSDGREWRLSTVLSGGTYLTQDFSRPYLECDGRRLHQLAAERVPGTLRAALDGVGWSIDDLALGVPHQTSTHTIREISRQSDFPLDRVAVTVDTVGNTAAASIPLALSMAVDEGRVQSGDKILLVGGAAGFSTCVIPLVW